MTPAPQTSSARQALREAERFDNPGATVESAAARAAALAMARDNHVAATPPVADEEPFFQYPPPATDEDEVISIPTSPAGDAPSLDSDEEPLSPSSFGGHMLQSIYPNNGPIDYYYCSHSPAPVFQSRFEALADHRKHTMELLKDIEPNLDWYTGPWDHEKSELLWTGDEEAQYRAMFSVE